jgi:hypothetical protein
MPDLAAIPHYRSNDTAPLRKPETLASPTPGRRSDRVLASLAAAL